MKQLLKMVVLTTLFFTTLNADITVGYADIGQTNKPAPYQLIDIQKLHSIAKKNNIKIQFKALPWKRALLLIKKGRLDGVINASYKLNRAEYAHYPMSGEGPDTQKRLNDGVSYYIYKNKKSTLNWDGVKFSDVDGSIGVMSKYAVMEDLKKHNNITIKEFNSNSDIIRQLAKGKISAYAGSSRVVDDLLREFESLSNMIIRESIPIRRKEYYLIFSKKIFTQKRNEIEKIWNGLKAYNIEKDSINK